MTTATAPGKIILFGEHAVVYGKPAIAVPVSHVRATATVEAANDGQITLILPDVAERWEIECALPEDGDEKRPQHPLIAAIRHSQRYLALPSLPSLTISVQSDIPIAGGMGSGAATAAALIRALLVHLNASAETQTISTLTYKIEEIHHGTPSGIDNSVVSHEQAIFFRKAAPQNELEPIQIGTPFRLLIADTGQRATTRAVVAGVRQRYEQQTRRYQSLFSKIEHITKDAKFALQQGSLNKVGALMTLNQIQLRRLGVSNRALDDLVDVALKSGALGAKLSGAGAGGNMIAMVSAETEHAVTVALKKAGAVAILATTVA